MSKAFRNALLLVCGLYVLALVIPQAIQHAHAGIIVYGPPWVPDKPEVPWAWLLGLVLVVAMMFL